MVKRALPILILLSAAYGGWYYWQSLPTDPLAVKLLQLEPEEVVKLSIQPAQSIPFEALRTNSSWQLSDGERHLVESSQLPDTLLEKILSAHSQDLIDADSIGRLQVEINMDTRAGNSYRMYIHCASKSDCRNLAIRIAPRPESVLVNDFELGDLPLAFDDYRNTRLYDLAPLGSLDSIVWRNGVDEPHKWSYVDAESGALDSINRSYELATFADYFDEINHKDRFAGRYHLYGARQDLELSVYLDSQWIHPIVVSSSQFPSAFFGLDSLSELGLPLPQGLWYSRLQPLVSE